LREAADTWSTIKDTTNTSVLETYIARYQGTFYADLARRQLEELRKGQQANTATVAPSKSANTPPDAATTKRSLKLFKDVLARVQSDYVEERGEQVLVQTAVDGMLKKFPSGSGAESAKVLAIMPAKRTVGHNDQLLVPFGDVLQHVHREHGTGTGGVDPVIVAALEHMLAALDPHSAYLSPKHFRDMQTQTRGEFGGLGIEVSMENGAVKVVSPIDDTPAAAGGVQTNDLITHLDGASVAGLTLEQAVEKMRGPVNTSITLTIVRKGRDTPFDLKIVRAVIRINAVKARQEGDVIYIKISTFNEQAHPNLVKAVEALKKTMGKNIKGYIVDLRGNPGGLLDQAIQVTDDFLEKGAIVLTKARNAETQRANAQPGDVTGGKRLIVLINGGSASASEIVAGALQDHKRAIVVGTRSFGKGSVQTIIPLGADNGAIRLTTARYYTPSGRSIQAQGIEPDVVVEQEQAPEPQSNTPPTSEARLPGHLKNKHGTESSGSSSYVPKDPDKDTQLQHALKALRSQR
jgi:carboxyl-terminal processing protease